MVDRLFSETRLAELYDVLHPPEQRADFAFYLTLVMSAASVLDVGCGTGALLRLARDAGHPGRLVGLDPADAMLDVARGSTDIEWVLGDLSTVHTIGEFDLVVMTGHAFQVLLTDEELSGALAAIRVALTEGGRFVFESRSPSAREWERWTPAEAVERVTPSGSVLRMEHDVETPVRGDLVSFTTTFSSSDWSGPEVSRSTLRFLGAEQLSEFLSEAGLRVEEQYGDWDCSPLTDESPEIITLATRAN